MAEKSFGIKELNLIGASGTPTIESPNDIVFNSGGSNERIRITSGGNIGVNTTTFAANGTNFKISDGTISRLALDKTGANARKFEIGNFGTGLNVYDVTADAERLRITSTGYVGIGEGAPGGRLTVRHANTATSGLNATLKLKQGNATNGNRSSLIFSSLDNFDVAAVNGVVEVHSGTSANNVGRLEFWTKASGSDAEERVRITSAGDVGIGEDSPANRLVVQKDNASGDVAVRIKNDTLTDGDATNPTTASLYLNTSTGDFNTFYIQARRNDNDTHFGYSDPRSNGHTPNMIISNDGLITTPNRPRFIAKLSANTTYNPSNFGSHVDFDSEEYDIGGNFTTSGTDQGLFTAPVAGLYQFTASAYCVGQALTQSWFVVNGSRKNCTDWVLSSTADFAQNSQAIYLDEGDKVGFHPHKGGTSSFTVNVNVHHTYFSGYLVG